MSFKTLKRRLNFVTTPLLSPLKNGNRKISLAYARAAEKPIWNKTIFFEAYLGKSMTGNSYAIFKEIYHDNRFKNYTFIWSLDDLSLVPQEFKGSKNIKYVSRQSKPYAVALARSEYLVTDTTFPHYFNKRAGEQTYIMAWHGTPYKTIGKDIKNAAHGAHRNVMKNILHTDYFISPCTFTTETILKSQDSYELFSGTVIETGMPRTDLMFKANPQELKEALNIPKDKKIVLYAPTWNDFVKNPKITGSQLAKDIQALQNALGDEYAVFLKAHYLEYAAIQAAGSNINLIDNAIDTNQLLSVIDHLVTDYSSIFFDFLPANKPVHFYFKNYEQYAENRGMYLDNSELPGSINFTVSELSTAIEQTSRVCTASQMERFAPYDNGEVTKRIVDHIFFKQPVNYGLTYQTTTSKEKLLFYSGFFKNNGISESFIRMSNHLDYTKYHLTVIIPTILKKNPAAISLIERLNPNITLLYPVGTRINGTIFQEYAYKAFLNRGLQGFVKKLNIPKLFNTEAHRLTGNCHFDKAIDFSGYSSHFGAVIAFGNSTGKATFLHSDMQKDKERVVSGKRPNKLSLQAMFSIYPYFNKLVSVSESSFQANKQKIGVPYNLSDKMTYVVNYLDAQRVFDLEDAYTELTINNQKLITDIITEEDTTTVLNVKGIPSPNPSDINYVTLGRLSPEKNQTLLVESFAKVVNQQPNSKLYIIGDGPQKNKLVALTRKLNIEDKVIFVGHMSNPFFLLKKCDVFVLTSSYEGQALVILEALTVGLKVVSTDIPGPDNILREGYGELVEATDIGLAKKMLSVISSDHHYKSFDAPQYDTHALAMFEQMLAEL